MDFKIQHRLISTRFWKNKVFPIAIITSLGFFAVYVILGLLGITDTEETSKSIGNVSRWCERVSSGVFKEPVNALSNLGFVIVGLLMLRVLSRDPQNAQNDNSFHRLTPVSTLYAGTVIYLGIGSMLMHGTNTNWGAWADNLSMIMYILLPWLINVGGMAGWTKSKFFIVYFCIVLIYAFCRWFLGSRLGVNLDLFGLSIGLWIISEALFRFWSPQFRWISGFVGFVVAAVFGITPLEIFSNIGKYWWVILFWIPGLLSTTIPTRRRNYNPWFFLGMFAYFFSFVIWTQGKPNTAHCNPDSLIQLHGIWHLMTALATWCFFKFFRTERALRM